MFDDLSKIKMSARSTAPVEPPTTRKSKPPYKPKLGQPLSAREAEVTWQICCGFTSEEIGDRYGISMKTVEAHSKTACIKLGANNRPHLVYLYLKGRYGF